MISTPSEARVRVNGAQEHHIVPGAETALAPDLGLSANTLRLIGDETRERLERDAIALSTLVELHAMEPNWCDPSELLSESTYNIPRVDIANRLCVAINTFTATYQHGGSEAEEAERQIEQLVPQVSRAALPTDLGVKALEDAERISRIAGMGMLQLRSLPQELRITAKDEQLGSMIKFGELLSAIRVTRPDAVDKLYSLITAERTVSAVEQLEILADTTGLKRFARILYTLWVDGKAVFCKSEDDDVETAEVAGIDGEPKRHMTLEPVVMPENQKYRPVNQIMDDGVRLKSIGDTINEFVHRVGQTYVVFRTGCCMMAECYLADMANAVLTGISQSEENLAASLPEDLTVYPYNLLPPDAAGNVDPRHLLFIEQARAGSLAEIDLVKTELKDLVKRMSRGWSVEVTTSPNDPEQVKSEQPPVTIPKVEALAIVVGMANSLQQTQTAELSRILNGRVPKSLKRAASEGDPEAQEELLTRSRLRQLCGFEPDQVGIAMSIINGCFDQLLADQQNLSMYLNDLGNLAKQVGSPSLLVSHPLQALARYDIAKTLRGMEQKMLKSRDRVHGALTPQQLAAIKEAIETHATPLPQKSAMQLVYS